MFDIDKNLQKTILIYLIFSFFIYKSKSSLFFTNNKELKHFGLGTNKTIHPYWMVTLLFGLFIYLIISIRNDDFV